MSGKLRIAIFSDSALPIINGVSISVQALVKELRAQGHSAHLYANRYPGHREIDPDTHRFFALELPFWKGYPFTMPPLEPVLRRFRSQKYDLIHTHTPFLVGMIGLRWGESHEIPTVSTYHTLYDRYAHYVPLIPPRFVRYRIARHTHYYYQRVAHVITPSAASLRWLRRHAVNTPATIIPTGSPLPIPQNRNEVRAALGIAPDNRIILYVGRLAPEKNLSTLLRGVARVLSRMANARLWIIGDGPYRSACASLAAELGISDRVRFFGFMPREQLDAYYAAADVFAFASITETQGLVIQEAMLHRLAVVAVAGGGASESIRANENAILTADNPEFLGSAILALLQDDDLRQRIADRGFDSQRSQTVTAMVDRIVGVYEKVLSRGADADAIPE